MAEYLKTNLNWIIPLLITTIFSFINIILFRLNYKILKQQQKLQNDAFCFQLFDRRLDIYSSIKEIISRVIANNSVSRIDIDDFLKKRRDVDFLFGKDVSDHCKSIYNTLTLLHRDETKMNSPASNASNWSNLVDEETRLLEQLSDEGVQLSNLILKYISFSKYKILE